MFVLTTMVVDKLDRVVLANKVLNQKVCIMQLKVFSFVILFALLFCMLNLFLLSLPYALYISFFYGE